MTKEQAVDAYDYNTGNFTEQNWHALIDRVALLFDFTDEKKEQFRKNKLAELIAAIPFLAGCDEPEREALSNLSITHIAAREGGKDLFSHNFSDNSSLLKRLDPISRFTSGNQAIIDRGMALLAVIMLSDHLKDMTEDEKKGKYNPLSSGIWKYKEQIDKLERSIKSVPCPKMDEIITFEEAKAYWWEYYG